MKNNQLGRFNIDVKLIRNNPNLIAKVFALLGIVPVRAECLYAEGVIEYVAICNSFLEIEEDPGQIPPEYKLIIRNNGNLTADFILVSK